MLFQWFPINISVITVIARNFFACRQDDLSAVKKELHGYACKISAQLISFVVYKSVVTLVSDHQESSLLLF